MLLLLTLNTFRTFFSVSIAGLAGLFIVNSKSIFSKRLLDEYAQIYCLQQ